MRQMTANMDPGPALVAIPLKISAVCTKEINLPISSKVSDIEEVSCKTKVSTCWCCCWFLFWQGSGSLCSAIPLCQPLSIHLRFQDLKLWSFLWLKGVKTQVLVMWSFAKGKLIVWSDSHLSTNKLTVIWNSLSFGLFSVCPVQISSFSFSLVMLGQIPAGL